MGERGGCWGVLGYTPTTLAKKEPPGLPSAIRTTHGARTRCAKAFLYQRALEQVNIPPTVFLGDSPPLSIRITRPVTNKHPPTNQTGTRPLGFRPKSLTEGRIGTCGRPGLVPNPAASAAKPHLSVGSRAHAEGRVRAAGIPPDGGSPAGKSGSRKARAAG